MPWTAKPMIRGVLVAAVLHGLASCAVPPPAGEHRTIAATAAGAAQDSWNFVVSGDSRNCGDVVMPAIAAGARNDGAAFYWHLGDLRAIYNFDQDYLSRHPDATIADYHREAWTDFISEQIEPFGALPFYLGIGNHETIAPKSRAEFLLQFADWLATPELQQQRLLDDPHDHALRGYYHWTRGGIDFINLDNASDEQFDDAQLNWLQLRLDHAAADPAIRAVVVGMHKALPESLARDHSMSDLPQTEATGLIAYRKLLALRERKPVYVLASHSHFYLGGLYDTAYWREHGGVLPGWIVGTAGAERYHLPADLQGNREHREHAYGYLLATVGSDAQEPIHFRFVEVRAGDLPAASRARYDAKLIRACYEGNARP